MTFLESYLSGLMTALGYLSVLVLVGVLFWLFGRRLLARMMSSYIGLAMEAMSSLPQPQNWGAPMPQGLSPNEVADIQANIQGLVSLSRYSNGLEDAGEAIVDDDVRENGAAQIVFEQVHTDNRGDMYQILLPTGQEVMLLFSKKGSLRGGHSHTVPEVVALLSGRLEYHKILNQNEHDAVYCSKHGVGCYHYELQPGKVVVNTPNEPHYGEFLEDSWLLEFKYGPNCAVGGWENVDFEPFRALVRESIA